ncbi:hypothetical protein CXG81DRAFT_19299 [Caulochytrium protostelioides]|uniref:CCHC-type domain-containing protein n=1 Tax=Caulochytrium protostelioides TaxID=1555241 RepID=A0A4P9X6K4_9FUNG|nr:hypothetical protein CXG81DRAFT_19299 [Caulochytrium protostelioides]|eukprot:RKP00827.1 hypothetical protein CXG81DRAFT_19299 [Caulochytrium protostelioides]
MGTSSLPRCGSKIDSQWQDVQALPTLNLVEDMRRNQQKTGESVDRYAQRLQLYLAQEAGESEGDLSKPFFAKLFLSGLLAPIREKTRDLLLSADLAASYSDFVPVARKAQFIVGSFKEFQPTRRPFDGGPYKPQTAANSFGRPVTNGIRDPVDDLSNKFRGLKVHFCRRCDDRHEVGYCPSVTCHACQQPGHYANECPQIKSRSKGVNAVYLIDEDDEDLVAAVAKRQATPIN